VKRLKERVDAACLRAAEIVIELKAHEEGRPDPIQEIFFPKPPATAPQASVQTPVDTAPSSSKKDKGTILDSRVERKIAQPKPPPETNAVADLQEQARANGSGRFRHGFTIKAPHVANPFATAWSDRAFAERYGNSGGTQCRGRDRRGGGHPAARATRMASLRHHVDRPLCNWSGLCGDTVDHSHDTSAKAVILAVLSILLPPNA
jgi:hypothetical protein